ncbi:hypothetical protein CTI12_AA258460 [Artemisia annua]|uniref:Uncharacterized protein n=1 Tax=Artemisia annua TaxID=35608 RepID=A0A2U1NJP7_ARTAN|nr:hypothetical protein CTI12_AA258460 [Artemisia annua]
MARNDDKGGLRWCLDLGGGGSGCGCRSGGGIGGSWTDLDSGSSGCGVAGSWFDSYINPMARNDDKGGLRWCLDLGGGGSGCGCRSGGGIGGSWTDLDSGSSGCGVAGSWFDCLIKS